MATSEARSIVFVGTYTAPSGGGRGVHRFELDRSSGAMVELGVATDIQSPSFLALGPERATLYAVAELDEIGAAVAGFAIEGDGAGLVPTGAQPTNRSAPCYVRLAPSGRALLVANYSGGAVAAFPLDESGRLEPMSCEIQHEGSSVNPERQREPHPHSIVPTPDGGYALVPDLGTDRVVVYRLEDGGRRLVRHGDAAATPGAGPRHLSFHPDGRHAFVSNELDSTISAYAWSADGGELEHVRSVSTLPTSFRDENYPADVHVHPSGRYVYLSNRGHDSIAGFSIDGSGHLEPIGREPTQGRWPRNFTIDASGTLLLAANQGSDTIVAFSIDTATGALTPTGATTAVGAPTCVQIVE
jgi:6-phosphogluconolactonase